MRLENVIRTGSPNHALELHSALERCDLRVRMQCDVGCFGDSPDQIVRHGGGQSLGPDQQVYVPALACQVHRGLARRISAADHDHIHHLAAPRLGGCCGVVNAVAEKAGRILQRELAVLRAGGDDDGTCTNHGPEPELDTVRPLIAIQPQRRVGGADFGAEFLCLNPRSGGQRQPGNAGGKPEIVLYFRARAGLASGRSCFEHQYVQSLGGAVHRGGQA